MASTPRAAALRLAPAPRRQHRGDGEPQQAVVRGGRQPSSWRCRTGSAASPRSLGTTARSASTTSIGGTPDPGQSRLDTTHMAHRRRPDGRTRHGQSVTGVTRVAALRLRWRDAAADLRCRDRVRGHVHLPRAAAPLPGRGGPLPVPPGRVVGAFVERLPAQRGPALPGRRQPPRVRHGGVRLARPARRARQGGGADPRGPARRRRAAAGRRGHRRRHLPVQEQHRLGGQLLRLPRELPGRPGRGVLPDRRRAAALPGHPAADLRRRARCCRPHAAPCTACPSAPSTSGRASPAPPPGRARSSTPATSRTPTPSATAGCTSSSATRTCPRSPPCSRSGRPRWCWR